MKLRIGLRRVNHSSQMILMVVVGTILLLAALFQLTQAVVDQEREKTFENIQVAHKNIALSDEARVKSTLASLDKVLLVLRRDYLDKPKLSREELLVRIEDLKIEAELHARVAFADASGQVQLVAVKGVNDKISKLDVSDREFFQWHQSHQEDKLYVGIPVLGRISDEWVLPISRRIYNKDGSFGGLVVVFVVPSLLSDPINKTERTNISDGATRSIMGMDGYTRLRLNDDKLSYGGDSRKSQLYQEVKKSPIGCYTGIAASDGVRRSVCYRAIDPYSLIVVSGSSIATIEGIQSGRAGVYIAGASLTGVLIAILSGLLIVGILRQKQLLESQQRFNELIELVPQSIIRLDARGTIVWTNRRTAEYAGHSEDDQGKGFDWVTDAVHPEDRDRLRAHRTSAVQGHVTTESCEYRKRRFDGAYLWHSARVSHVRGDDKGEEFYLMTGTDIHDRKMAEERARVTQKLEAVGQLTGGMAHDFNNLLAIVIGNLDMLKPTLQLESDAKRLNTAIGAAERGVSLVKSLLALASKQPLLPTTIDLGALIERISPLLRHALGQRIHFEMKVHDGMVHVEVDEAGLEAAVLNLFVNARDAMPLGGEVTLSLTISDGMAHIEVVDNGTGMPETVIKRATEPFFTTKEQGRGTGLGLSMVAGFAKQSGGKLRIYSVVNQGTTVVIDLPLVQAAQAVPAQVYQIEPAIKQIGSAGKHRILIVDDERELAELVQDWVKADGYIAVVAHTAEDALTLLAIRAFDVVVTDINMPGQLDGIGFAEKAKSMYPAMKIIVMSGYSKEAATDRADWAWPLLVKPFSKTQLLAAIENERENSGFGVLA